MDFYNTDAPHKTSTPVRSRPSHKRLSNDIASSPIFSSNYKIKKRNDVVNADVSGFDFDNELFSEEVFKNSQNKTKKENEITEADKGKFISNKFSSTEVHNNPSGHSLLSSDDSFLRYFDLNSATSDINYASPSSNIIDGFTSLNCSILPDNIDNENDHAWDMSINADIKHENCDKIKCSSSQEKNENYAINSMIWQDESLINRVQTPDKENKLLQNITGCDNVSFGSKIKTILLKNAQKPALKISQNWNNGTQESLSVMNTSFFGLPLLVKALIKKYKGISQLYDWQEECLKLEAIKNRKNLVYALPTSGGKTLVAEILILNEILSREKNVIFVMPYVSIVQEKVRSLSPFAVELCFLIEEYAGAKGQYPPQKRRRKHTVFIATIEKALGLVHSYLETNRMSELGLVVIDELHLIGESRRGAALESMLSKLMFSSEAQHIQVIGMSATIGNINEVAKFLKAEVYTHDFRPVELNEFIKVHDEVFSVSPREDPPLTFRTKTSFPYSPELKKQDPDEVGGLVREISPHESCLVFCPSKKNCENVAILVCQVLDRELLKYKVEEKQALYKALASEGNGSVCSILCKTLPYGVAYHNSGLTTAERKLIEEAFCAKTIFCICCTSTLAAGVNLPAKRVILRSPYVGREFINLSRYKQMVGRAGRAGMSGGAGESFLICRPADTQKVGEFLRAPMDYCKSHLFEKQSLSSFILSAIGLSIATSIDSLKELMKCTLLFIQSTCDTDLNTLVNETLSQLVQSGAVKVTKKGSLEELKLSDLGKAATKGGLDMDTALMLYNDLQLSRKSLVLLNHMHLLYLITPYSMMEQIKLEQRIFIEKFLKLNSNEIHVATVLGIDERSVSLMMSGRKIKSDLQERVHRLYLTLILYDLWNENSIWLVSDFYQISRGLVHTLLNSAVSFSASVSRFCEELEELWCFRRLLIEITSRLSHCCKLELIPLMELPAVKIGRARQLYDAGFKTVNIIANAEPQSLVKAIDHLPRKVAHQIVAAAKLKLLTTAETLQEEAEEVLALLHNKMAAV